MADVNFKALKQNDQQMSVINNSCSRQLMILHYISYNAHSTDGENIYCAVAQYRLCKSVRLFNGVVWK